MKRPYLRNYTRYSDGIDIRIIAMPKFIFISVHTWGISAVVFTLLKKNYIFGGHLGFHAIEKNAQHLQVGIHQI